MKTRDINGCLFAQDMHEFGAIKHLFCFRCIPATFASFGTDVRGGRTFLSLKAYLGLLGYSQSRIFLWPKNQLRLSYEELLRRCQRNIKGVMDTLVLGLLTNNCLLTFDCKGQFTIFMHNATDTLSSWLECSGINEV